MINATERERLGSAPTVLASHSDATCADTNAAGFIVERDFREGKLVPFFGDRGAWFGRAGMSSSV